MLQTWWYRASAACRSCASILLWTLSDQLSSRSLQTLSIVAWKSPVRTGNTTVSSNVRFFPVGRTGWAQKRQCSLKLNAVSCERSMRLAVGGGVSAFALRPRLITYSCCSNHLCTFESVQHRYDSCLPLLQQLCWYRCCPFPVVWQWVGHCPRTHLVHISPLCCWLFHRIHSKAIAHTYFIITSQASLLELHRTFFVQLFRLRSARLQFVT